MNKKIPNALVVVALGILAIRFFGNQFTDVAIVKDIPSGLPKFGVPDLDFDQMRELLPIALSLITETQ